MTRMRPLVVVLAAVLATLPAIPAAATVEPTTLKNLDRIDEDKYPLDGNYAFPDSAGAGVNIYIVSTGINTLHTDFEGRATFGGSFCPDCLNLDDNGSGTLLASVAMGKKFGVAKKANAVAVKTVNATGNGSVSDYVNGLKFVLREHNKSRNKNTVVLIDGVIEPHSDHLNTAVKVLTANRVHVVVPAGNRSADACDTSPASELSAVTVGAIELTSDEVTDFSNVGSCVDLFAPGRDIEGALHLLPVGSRTDSGTGLAAAHVAGAIALIIAKDGNTTPAEMATKLRNLATKNAIEQTGLRGSPNLLLHVPAP